MPRLQKRYMTMMLGIVVGAILSWIVLKSTDWQSIRDTGANIDYSYLLLSLALMVLVWMTRALRFLMIVEPSRQTPFLPYLYSVIISEFIDVAIPLRLGVPVRAFTLSRLRGIPFMRGAAATILDRMLDLFGVLVLMITTVAFLLPLGQDFRVPAELLGREEPFILPASGIIMMTVTFATGVAGLTVAIFLFWALRDVYGPRLHRVLAIPLPSFSDRIIAALTRFAGHLNAFVSWRQVASLAVVNILIWILTLANLASLFATFGLSTPIYTPLLTLTFIMIVLTLLPPAPAHIGQYHLAIVLAVSVLAPETPLEAAGAAAIFIHLTHMGGSLVLGTFCLATSHISLRELRGAESAMEADAQQLPTAQK